MLASLEDQYFPFLGRLGFDCTNNMAKYEAYATGILMDHIPLRLARRKLDGRHPSNPFIHALSKLGPRNNHSRPAPDWDKADNKPWYHDIKEYLQKSIYLQGATKKDKRTLRRLVANFFFSRPFLYKRSMDLTLLRYMDDQEAKEIIEEVHEGVFDNIHVAPFALHNLTSLWPFSMWGPDIIGPIELKASNWHRFILVAIDYFRKWVEATSYANVTKSVVVNFIKRDIICRYGLMAHIITDNGTNLNNKMMTKLCEQFMIKHHHSTPYHPKMNGAVEVANKNIKKIVQKTMVIYKDWHDMLPYALHGY
ncbi:Pol polyprotein, partial [Mucuna pruriens]